MRKEGTMSACGECGGAFYLPPSHRNAVNYCSRSCRAKAQSKWQRQDLAVRFWRKVDKRDGCWQWTGARLKTGYGSIRVDHRAVRAHRVAYELTKGPIPQGLHLMHLCDNRLCCNPDHLLPGTRAENMQDAKRKGRHAHGERHGHSKLTTADIAFIRAAHAGGATGRSIARRFGVTEGAISNIVNLKRWV